MRILFICNEYPPAPHGGIGSYTKTMAKRMVALGHEVTILGHDTTIGQDSDQLEEGVRVLRIKFKVQDDFLKVGKYSFLIEIIARFYLSFRLVKYCRNFHPDIIESYDWSGPLLFRPRHIPLVVRLHGANTANAYYENRKKSRIISYFEKKNILMADHAVAVSHHIGKITMESMEIQKPYQVIYNGIDPSIFHPVNVDRNNNNILFVGTVCRRKGIFELFDALPKVFNSIPGATVDIVGRLPNTDVERIQLIQSLLSKIPVQYHQKIRFHGVLPYTELPQWYSAASVAVFPSLAEAFGLTCAEAMACGCPVIMTSRASGPELVQHNKSGYMVDPLNVEKFAEAIIQLLSDDDTCNRISKTAKADAYEKFSIEKITTQNIVFYTQCLNE